MTVLDLFGKLLDALQGGGYITHTELVNAREEFETFDVDIRLNHKSSGGRAEEIPDIIAYLSKDYVMLQRRNLLRVS